MYGEFFHLAVINAYRDIWTKRHEKYFSILIGNRAAGGIYYCFISWIYCWIMRINLIGFILKFGGIYHKKLIEWCDILHITAYIDSTKTALWVKHAYLIHILHIYELHEYTQHTETGYAHLVSLFELQRDHTSILQPHRNNIPFIYRYYITFVHNRPIFTTIDNWCRVGQYHESINYLIRLLYKNEIYEKWNVDLI